VRRGERRILKDRDYLIFFLLLLGVVLLNVIPLPQTLRMVLFALLVVAQAIFIYNGLRRGRS